MELLAPKASLLRKGWTVSSCKRLPGETQRRDATGRHNRKMMQNEKKLNSDHSKADEIGLVGV